MADKKDDQAKSLAVSTRLDIAVVTELDRMAAEIRPKPSRSQMVALAVTEFIDRGKKRRDR